VCAGLAACEINKIQAGWPPHKGSIFWPAGVRRQGIDCSV
jgi:hypothetical protein